MPPWVIAQLEMLEGAHRGRSRSRLRQNRSASCERSAPRKLLFGEGELTHELLARELIDPQRFRNGRQVGNYFGLCPSESTATSADGWVRSPSTAIRVCAA